MTFCHKKFLLPIVSYDHDLWSLNQKSVIDEIWKYTRACYLPSSAVIVNINYLLWFHEQFQQEGNCFSQAGKTFWTELVYIRKMFLKMVKQQDRNLQPIC